MQSALSLCRQSVRLIPLYIVNRTTFDLVLFTYEWFMSIARLLLKVKVIGRGHRSKYGRWDRKWEQFVQRTFNVRITYGTYNVRQNYN